MHKSEQLTIHSNWQEDPIQVHEQLVVEASMKVRPQTKIIIQFFLLDIALVPFPRWFPVHSPTQKLVCYIHSDPVGKDPIQVPIKVDGSAPFLIGLLDLIGMWSGEDEREDIVKKCLQKRPEYFLKYQQLLYTQQ